MCGDVSGFEVKVWTMDRKVSKQMADQNEQQQRDEQCSSGFERELSLEGRKLADTFAHRRLRRWSEESNVVFGSAE